MNGRVVMQSVKVFFFLFLISLLSACAINKKKNFEGIKIIYFAGGFSGDPVSSIIYNGAKQAESDYGCDVEYVFSNWDSKKMLDDFKDAIEKKPDGICVMGHAGDTDMMPLVDEAIRKGIIVTSQNVDIPQTEEKYDYAGFGYVGQNIYGSGYNLAKLCFNRLKLKSGDRIVIWGGLPNPRSPRKSRTDGMKDFFSEHKIKPDILEMRVEDRINPLSKGFEHFNEYYKANPDLKLLIVNGGVLTGYAAEILKKAGISARKIHCAGFDLSEGSLSGIRDGYIDFINDQQPYLQGYLPVLQICFSKAYGFSGLHINTDSSYIDESNAAFFEKFVKSKIR
jgi:simple sugar transport system substrate-binding protein